MKRFKNILVVLTETPIDERVLVRATELAATNHARLTVKSVEYAPPAAFRSLAGEELQEHLEQATEKRDSRLETIKAEAQQRVEDVSTGLLPRKNTFIAITRAVLEEGYDLIMMADDAPHSFKEKFFGTTVSHLLRKCPCPVWAFKPSRQGNVPPPFRRILAAVNTGGTEKPDEEEQILNKKILDLATSLTRMEDAELHVIHCWEAVGESIITDWQGSDSPKLDQYLTETRSHHRRHFKELLASYSGCGVVISPHMPQGDAGLKIPEFATRYKIDLVIMGTLARTGISGLLIGSTAEQVLQRLGCSLLAVKPEGFVSPVASRGAGQ